MHAFSEMIAATQNYFTNKTGSTKLKQNNEALLDVTGKDTGCARST